MRGLVKAVVLFVAVFLAQPAEAQVVYTYLGNPFTTFSCGPDPDGQTTCSVPDSDSRYSLSSRLQITLELANPLPPNFHSLDITQLPGFRLTMDDGLGPLYFSAQDQNADGILAMVRTDGAGRIVEWHFGLFVSGYFRWMESGNTLGWVFDEAVLVMSQPPLPADFARVFGAPGTWSHPGGPEAAIQALIDRLPDPSLGLTQGQINSLTAKLNDALASVLAGLHQQARNQLNAFINQVTAAVANGKMDPAVGAGLMADALRIIAML